MKDTLKRLAPAPVIAALGRARSFLRAFDRHATVAYSQEGEDLVLSRMFERRGAPGFYVDVGAHHPRRFSNTYLLYRSGWRGINIEPNPSVRALFQRERPRDVNLSVGVSDQPGELTYIMFDEPALNSFDERQAQEVEAGGRFRIIRRVPIPVQRLDAILRANLDPGTRIDVLTVDVEGHDLAVLQSNDWTTFRPGCVLVEAYGKSFETIVGTPVHEFLSGHGYALFAKTVNTLIYVDPALRD